MSFTLPPLPYSDTALAPHISKETLEYHHGKHHQTYVTNLNKLVAGTPEANKSLEELIKTQTGPVFNNAAQIWNHTFYWKSMCPGGGGNPSGKIGELITRDFGGLAQLKEKFNAAATTHFGSGWAWLVQTKDGKLEVVGTHDAANPIQQGKSPLLVIDVWEHAYYIDYRNRRADYVNAWWNLVNWKFANERLSNPSAKL